MSDDLSLSSLTTWLLRGCYCWYFNRFCDMKNADGKTAFAIAEASQNSAVVTALKDGGDPAAASAACIVS